MRMYAHIPNPAIDCTQRRACFDKLSMRKARNGRKMDLSLSLSKAAGR
jgi:hypothetical protein